MKQFAAGAALAAALVVTSAVADSSIKSGPAEGKSVPAFHPLNVTGRAAGQKNCLV